MKNLAIVTGVSRGIGAACARSYLRAGWRVLGFSRGECAVEGVEHHRVDLLDDNWQSLVAAALKGAVEQATPSALSLVHNAAMMEKDTALTLEADSLRRVLELNLVVPAMLNRMVDPYLTPGSSILYIGSTLATKAVAGTASYVASKHALVGLMRATCQDLAGRSVHTACICPGFTATEMLLTHLGDDPAVRSSIESMSTFGRLIEPAEIADFVFQCAGNAVINGAVLHANLGQIER